MEKCRLDRVRERREVTEEGSAAEAEEEEERGGIASGLANLIIKTAGTKQEAAEMISETLYMKVV